VIISFGLCNLPIKICKTHTKVHIFSFKSTQIKIMEFKKTRLRQRVCDTSANEDDTTSIKDQLINMICDNPDLPTLGTSISNVVQISLSVNEPTQQLANLILSDVALTQKVLHLSNSATFRSSSNHVVTSVSRAIQLLGLDTIKACALAMILVDGMPKSHAKYVRYELALALSASLIGRKLAKRSSIPDAEEVAIISLFKNMGRLLVAAFDVNLYKRTMALVKNGTHTKAQASLETIGCSFDTLTAIAMREWRIPATITNAMKLLPSKALKPPKNREEWMQQVAEFSESSAELALQIDQSADNNLSEALLDRFGVVLRLDQKQFETLLTDVGNEARELSTNAELKQDNKDDGLRSEDTNMTDGSGYGEDILDGLIFEQTDPNNSLTIKRHPSGKPLNALDQLLTGVQSLTEMTASGQYKINELILQVLETLYSSLGFDFATICLKDAKTNQFRARYALGQSNIKLQQQFVFPSTSSDDLFSLAIQRNVDLSISDVTGQKMLSMLPEWHRKLLPKTKSFIILPLVVRGKSIGFFYADRQQQAPEGISSDEMKLIKTLKGLILTTLNP